MEEEPLWIEIFGIFFFSFDEKKDVHEKSWEKKAFCLPVCLPVTEDSWIDYVWNYLNLTSYTIEIFNSDEAMKEQKIHAKKAFPWLVFALVFWSPFVHQNCWQKKPK